MELIDKVGANPMVASNLLFNIQMTYGSGIMPVRRSVVNGKLVLEPVYDNAEINEFFENNDINGYYLEQCTDLNFLYNAFAELVFSYEGKIAELNSLEATFSRFSEIDAVNKKILYHYYSAKWGESPKEADIIITPLLDSKNPIRDLKIRRGIIPDNQGKTLRNPSGDRFVIPITFPTPGKFYYQKPYWLSIITSGWYDFAQQIVEFKKALMANQMTIKYHVQLSDNYWDVLYKAEGIVDIDKKKARRVKELEDINKFLTDTKNTGRSIISYIKYKEGKSEAMMTVTAIDNKFAGGEYLDDLEEVSNVISYGMNVHPSLIGSAPGKNTTINGTEARELFIIKQAMMKPFRDRLLLPLYVVKAINNWPVDIFFTIPDIELTTLDQGTGSKKTIS
ncbi:MAG TPA: hypothetical protein VMW01_16755 [Williamwhitmania sp.]|nr:hypothetical protein [Williamwhitmania sp.]